MLTDWAIEKLKKRFEKIPFYQIDCPEGMCYGTLATYRVTFALVLFHAIMAVLTYGIKSANDIRASIQNGFWGVKFIAYIGLLVLSFNVPNDPMISYGAAASIFAAFFILIQLVLLIDLAYKWSEKCLVEYEMSDNRNWLYLLLFGTGILYVGSVVMTGFMYALFTGNENSEDCGLNKFFITFNLILGIIASFIAIHPRVQEENPQSGLPQASVVIAYTTYLVFSAISNAPNDKECSSGASWYSDKSTRTSHIVIGSLLTFVAIVYSTSSTAIQGQSFYNNSDGLEKGESMQLMLEDGGASNDADGELNDESDGCAYSYTFFHVVFATACMYIAMLLTSWDSIQSKTNEGTFEDDGPVQLGHSWQSVWAKVITSWLALLMYIWTLIAPIVLPDRDWN